MISPLHIIIIPLSTSNLVDSRHICCIQLGNTRIAIMSYKSLPDVELEKEPLPAFPSKFGKLRSKITENYKHFGVQHDIIPWRFISEGILVIVVVVLLVLVNKGKQPVLSYGDTSLLQCKDLTQVT